MVNKFGDYSFGGDEAAFLKNVVVVKKVIVRSGKYIDYSQKIQTSIKLGFQPYRIDTDEQQSASLVYAYNNQVWCLGSAGKVAEQITQETITKKNYLAYWVQGDISEGDGVIAIKGEQGRRGEQGSSGGRGQTGSQGVQGKQGSAGPQGGEGKRGATGAGGPPGKLGKMGPQGPPGIQGLQGSDGVQGLQGEPGSRGQPGEQGERGAEGSVGTQGRQGPKGGQGERGERGTGGDRGQIGPPGKQGQTGKPCTEKNIMQMFYMYMAPQLIENFQRTHCYIYYRVEREDDGIELMPGKATVKKVKK